MRKLFLLVVLTFTLPVANGYGQGAAYYNFRNPLHSIAGYNACMYVDSTAGVFYTVGNCWDSVNIISPGLAYPAFGIRFSKWRISDGQFLGGGTSQQGLLDTTTGNTRTYAINLGASPGLHRLANGSFLTAITTVDTGEYHRMGLLCMDSMGNKLWMKEFQKPNCVVPRADFNPGAMRRTAQGEWIIVGINQCNNFTTGMSFGDVVLMKLDSNFNLLWMKLFPQPPEYNFAPGALIIEPDGYVIGQTLIKKNSNDLWNPSIDRAHIFRVDTAGNMQWTWASDINEHEGAIGGLIRTPDSGFVYVGAGAGKLFDGGTGSANYKFRNIAKKLDKNRQAVQWQFVDTNAYSIMRRILPMPNGDYLMVGGTYNTPDLSHHSVLYRIDSTGNLRLQRSYTWDTTAPYRDATVFDMAFWGAMC